MAFAVVGAVGLVALLGHGLAGLPDKPVSALCCGLVAVGGARVAVLAARPRKAAVKRVRAADLVESK